jgi:hypothetical protein
MTEKEVQEIRAKLRANVNGPLRKLFYLRNGLPRQGLKTNDDIYNSLGIDLSNANTLEVQGVKNILCLGLAYLRKQAKDAKLGWIDWESTKSRTWEDANGETRTTQASIAAHGFLDDIDKFISNADKFEKIAENRTAIAQTTRDISTTQVKRIRLEQRKIAAS